MRGRPIVGKYRIQVGLEGAAEIYDEELGPRYSFKVFTVCVQGACVRGRLWSISILG